MSRRKGTPPLHVALQEAITSLIAARGIQPGEKIPSERELSRECRASRSSIRKAILALVHKGVLVRVPGKGTFVAAKHGTFEVSSSRTGNIGFVVFLSSLDRTRPDIRAYVAENGRVSWMPFYSEVFEGAHEELQRNDVHLLFFAGYQDTPSEKAKFGDFLKKVDGLIVCELASPSFAELLEASPVPVVLVNPSVLPRSLKADVLLMDNFGGAYQAVSYLIKLGHRAIGLINHPVERNRSARERFQGYKAALRRAGIAYDEALVEYGDWSMESGYAAMERLLKKGVQVTAIFATNDEMAIGAMKAAREHGLQVPEDLSIVGFDDAPISSNTFVALTTVRVYKREMGRFTVQRILHRIREPRFVPIQVIFPTEL
ncbi:MAG: GntR family transcriptional regulator, partial [Atribacterota bacterium]